MSDDGQVHFTVEGPVARIVVDRPHARNAMTWQMYEVMRQAFITITESPEIRVAVLSGAGDEAFISGTDISQFQAFETGKDGLEYNRTNGQTTKLLEAVPCPVIAVLRGAVTGGGLAIAACCDLRIAADNARFGVPVARTLGNLPAMPTIAQIVALVGPAKTKEMIFTARLWSAKEALDNGLVTEVHPQQDVNARVEELVELLQRRAPLTMAGVKEAVRRMVDATVPPGDDLIERVYGSEDFREGMAAFLQKRQPQWKNR